MKAAAAAAHLATTLALAQSPVISLPPAERLRLDHRLLASTSDPVLAASLRPTFGFEVPAVIATGDRTAVVAAYELTVQAMHGSQQLWRTGLVQLNDSASKWAPALESIPLPTSSGGPRQLEPDEDYEVTVRYHVYSTTEPAALLPSEPVTAAFSTRLVSGGNRSALFLNQSQWIIAPTTDPPAQHTIFRTVFFVPALPASSHRPRARVAAALLGCGYVSLNGHRLGNSVLGSVSQFDKTVRYDLFNASALIKHGEWNVLGASVGRCMAGLVSFIPSGPTCKIALWIDAAAGGGTPVEVVFTQADSSWLTAMGPSNAKNDEYLGENYDARVAEKLAKWDSSPNHTGSHSGLWRLAVPRPAAPPLAQNLQPQTALPPRVITQLHPVSITQPVPGHYVLDFGQEISGWLRLRRPLVSNCPNGATIRLRHAETLQTAPYGPAVGQIYVANLDGARAVDEYTCGNGMADDGEDGWAPAMTFHGFRYAEISGSGVVAAPTFDSVVAELVHSAVELTGSLSFGGGNNDMRSGGAALLNQLHSNIVWSQRDNLVGIPIAQNNRNERLGWTGDAGLSVAEAVINFDVAALEHEFVETIADCLDRDGGVPHVVPGNPGCNHDGSIRTDPSWASVYPQVTWQLLRAYGDRQLAKQQWRSLVRMLLLEAADAKTCPAAESPRTTVPNSPGCSPGGLANMSLAIFGDWTVPPSRGNFSSNENNQIHYTAARALIRDMETMIQMGQVLGGTFSQEAEQTLMPLVRAFREEYTARFFNPGSGLWGPAHNLSTPRDGPVGGQTVTAMALELGLANSSAAKHLVADVVKHGMHATVGILGNSVLFEQLALAGRSDVAEAVLTATEYPSFGFQILHPTQPATTLWERFDSDVEAPPMNRHNNIMWGAPDVFMYERLGGLAQSQRSIAWSELLVRITPSENRSSGSASVHTRRGLAAVSWAMIAPDVTCGMASEARALPGADGGVGNGFELRCNMPGSTISNISFASFGDPVGSCTDPSNFRSTHCEMFAAGPGSMGTSIDFQCLGQESCEVQAATMYWSPTPQAFATCPGPNATWSRRAAAVAECSLPGPERRNELLLVNVTVPQTATSLTHVPRLGRRPLYIWDAHPSSNRSVLLYPLSGDALPPGIIHVSEAQSDVGTATILIEHGPGSYWFVSSTSRQPPPPPPAPPAPPPAPPPLGPPGPLPAGDCNVSGVWYGGQAEIRIDQHGNHLTIRCPSAWGSAEATMLSDNKFVAQGGWCPPPKVCNGSVQPSALGPCSKMTMVGGMWCRAMEGKPHGVC
jgi:alpha-L-rhamnosidase